MLLSGWNDSLYCCVTPYVLSIDFNILLLSILSLKFNRSKNLRYQPPSITTSAVLDAATSSPVNPSIIVNTASTPPSSSAISPPPPPPPVKNVESSTSDGAQNITTTGIAQDTVSSATVTPLTETSSIVKAVAQTLTSSTIPSSVPASSPIKRDATDSVVSSASIVTNAVTSSALVTSSPLPNNAVTSSLI